MFKKISNVALAVTASFALFFSSCSQEQAFPTSKSDTAISSSQRTGDENAPADLVLLDVPAEFLGELTSTTPVEGSIRTWYYENPDGEQEESYFYLEVDEEGKIIRWGVPQSTIEDGVMDTDFFITGAGSGIVPQEVERPIKPCIDECRADGYRGCKGLCWLDFAVTVIDAIVPG